MLTISIQAVTSGFDTVWGAIDQALEMFYPKQEPYHYAPMISYMLGGPDPLEGIRIYERKEPVPHWYYVTYGFSELYGKESSVAKISGYGFELTFRLKKETGETKPPSWVNHFLNNLARYVFSTGNGFEAGHYMNLKWANCSRGRDGNQGHRFC